MIPTLIRHRTSVQYLSYLFATYTLVDGSTPVTPPASYHLAVTPLGDPPTTWNPGPYLAGPLTKGDYAVWLKVTDTPEVIVPGEPIAVLVVT